LEHKKNRSETGGYFDEMFMFLLNCRQAEFFSYKSAKRAMSKSKIIVILALFEPDEYVLVFALLA
jgi:hypothetical protein